MEGGEPVVIPNSEGSNRYTYRVVSFKADGSRIVGQAAKRLAVAQPDKTVISIKRHMGEAYKVNIDKGYSPQEISAMILSKLKADAESYLGGKVTDAVITCPAYFNDSQRQATKDAGKIAGLNVLRIINEPTAAALAYGLDKQEGSQKVMIYDLGGGTFDVSILEIGDGCVRSACTNGDTHLGGDDFDNKIIDWLVENFKKDTGVDLSKDRMAMQRLKEAAEKAKIELSGMTNTNINLPFITVVDGAPQHLDYDLSRQKFDSLTSDLVERTVEPMRKAMQDAGLTYNDIKQGNNGGRLHAYPRRLRQGKGHHGQGSLQGHQPRRMRGHRRSHSGRRALGRGKGRAPSGRNAPYARHRNARRRIHAPHRAQHHHPRKEEPGVLHRGRQSARVEINVLQGERKFAKDNKSLGRFMLTDIPPAPRGVPQIEVTFDVDANGIVNVTAKDLGTGKSTNITITASTNLSEEDIDKAVKDAERYAEEEKRKEAVDNKNNLESMIDSLEKTVKEAGDKLSEEDKRTVEDNRYTYKDRARIGRQRQDKGGKRNAHAEDPARHRQDLSAGPGRCREQRRQRRRG